jgi:hypothetical protein
MRRKLLVVACLSLLPITFAVLWFVQPYDPINAANFDQIQNGMTQVEVEKILGGPGDKGRDYGFGFSVVWRGRGRNAIVVDFGYRSDDHIVFHSQFFNPSLWERVKEWWGGYRLEPAA